MKKNFIRTSDSPSLWNFTLSPGWSEEDIRIFCLAIKKEGIGRWRKILDTHCLPGKNPGQLNLQAQRIMGQQSLSEFMRIRLDPMQIREENNKLHDCVRKHGLIINDGDKLTPADIEVKRERNVQLYEISEEESAKIMLPDRREEVNMEKTKEQLKNELEAMKERLALLEAELVRRKEEKIKAKIREQRNVEDEDGEENEEEVPYDEGLGEEENEEEGEDEDDDDDDEDEDDISSSVSSELSSISEEEEGDDNEEYEDCAEEKEIQGIEENEEKEKVDNEAEMEKEEEDFLDSDFLLARKLAEEEANNLDDFEDFVDHRDDDSDDDWNSKRYRKKRRK